MLSAEIFTQHAKCSWQIVLMTGSIIQSCFSLLKDIQLPFSSVWANSADNSLKYFHNFLRKQALTFHAICMKGQSLFSGKNKKNIWIVVWNFFTAC